VCADQGSPDTVSLIFFGDPGEPAAAWCTVSVSVPTCTAALRLDWLLLAATLNTSDPSPAPLAVLSVTQDAFVVAFHRHPPLAATATELPELALAATLTIAVESEQSQGGAAWVTVKAWPATVTVSVRSEVPVLAETL
jgi:hypothetical protein